jgi:hypothetical protein
VYDQSSCLLPDAAPLRWCFVRFTLVTDGFGNSFPQAKALTYAEGENPIGKRMADSFGLRYDFGKHGFNLLLLWPALFQMVRIPFLAEEGNISVPCRL